MLLIFFIVLVNNIKNVKNVKNEYYNEDYHNNDSKYKVKTINVLIIEYI